MVVIFDEVDGSFFISNLAVFRWQHWHFIWVGRHLLSLRIVLDDWFHGLLVIFAAVIAGVQMATLDVGYRGALAEFAADFELVVFVKARSSVVVVGHSGQTSSLGPRLRDSSLSVVILHVAELLLLDVIVGVRVDLRDFFYSKERQERPMN